MKLIISLIVLTIFGLSLISAESLSCTDSDGLNYLNKGIVNMNVSFERFNGTENITDYQLITNEDKCILNDSMVLEFYCDNLTMKGKDYTCPYGCLNGSCILNDKIDIPATICPEVSCPSCGGCSSSSKTKYLYNCTNNTITKFIDVPKYIDKEVIKEVPTEIIKEIVVRPVFYKDIWFYLSIVITLLLGGYIIFKS